MRLRGTRPENVLPVKIFANLTRGKNAASLSAARSRARAVNVQPGHGRPPPGGKRLNRSR